MTAKLVDDITETRSDKTRESVGQGIANIVTGFFGGMGGCAMIGQTMINVKVSGARTRLSTFCAGVFLLVLCVVLGDVVADDPDGRAGRRDDHGLGGDVRLAQHRPATLGGCRSGETVVMVVTVASTVATHNLAIGVGRRRAHRDGHLRPARRRTSWTSPASPTPTATTVIYSVTGELFFASTNELVDQFDYAGDPDR